MNYYNLRVYYYEHGTQYRIYSRPIVKQSEHEKEVNKNKKINTGIIPDALKNERTQEEIERL